MLWSQGYGTEGRNDVGETIRVVLGSRDLPLAATYGLVGVREGGRRRVLVPPGRLGFFNDSIGPIPPSFGSKRRLENHRDEPLLFEAEVRRIIKGAAGVPTQQSGSVQGGGKAYSLPAPPSPFKKNLG